MTAIAIGLNREPEERTVKSEQREENAAQEKRASSWTEVAGARSLNRRKKNEAGTEDYYVA